MKTVFSINEISNDPLSGLPPRLMSLEKHELIGDWSVKMMSSKEYVLSYVQEGKVRIIVRRRAYTGEKGDIFLYRPNEIHGGKAVNSDAYKTVIFRMDFADAPLQKKIPEKRLKGINKFSASKNWKLRSILDAIIAEFGKKEKNILLAKNYLLEIYAVVNEMMANKSGKFKLKKTGTNYRAEICLKAKEYIGKNYSKKISLKELAEHLALSESRFSHIFKEYTKMTPANYITRVRIEKAGILLKETDKKITEIAYDTGFSDPNYFNKVFKKLEKKTPTAYRNK